MNPAYHNLALIDNGTDAVAIIGTNGGLVYHPVVLDGGPAALNGAPIILPNVGLYAGSILTITPGTRLQMQPNATLDVYQGALNAVGTADQPITFTSVMTMPHAGDWRGIVLHSTQPAQLGYCDLSDAGGNTASGELEIDTPATQVQVNNCRIRDGATAGVYLNGVGITPTLQSTQVDHNAGAAVTQSTLDMNPTYRNLTLTNNGTDAVTMGAGNSNWVSHAVLLDGSPAALNGAPIILPGVFLWPSGALTITPGTRVQMLTNSQIDVYQGALNAVGTLTQPITFTSVMTTPQPGDWMGIRLRTGKSAQLANCDISFAGGNNMSGALIVETPNAQVNRCRVHQSSSPGLYLDIPGVTPVIQNSRIDANTGPAVVQTTFDMGPTYYNLSASGNSENAIVIGGGTLNSALVAKYDDPGLPMLINGNIGVAANRTLILGAGASLAFTTSTSLQVNGILDVFGAASNPVTLTAQSGVSGGWGGIALASGAVASLANCDIGYGGAGVPLVNIQAANVTLEACRVHHSAGDGLQVGNVTPALLFNQVYSNTFGLRNTGTITVDARSNYWGAPSGPFHPTLNPTGTGNPVSDRVLFNPWLAGPVVYPVVVLPTHGGDTGNVSVRTAGLAFSNGAGLKLVRTGQPDVIATHPITMADGSLQATLPLSGTALGAWDVVVWNGTGVTATLPGGFTVEPGDNLPNVWVDVFGPRAIHAGIRYGPRFKFVYGNSSNVDAPATHLRLHMPETWIISQQPEVPYVTYNDDASSETIYDVFVPAVPARSVQVGFSVRADAPAFGQFPITLAAETPAASFDVATLPLSPIAEVIPLSLITTTNSMSATMLISSTAVQAPMIFTVTTQPTSTPISPTVAIETIGDQTTIAYELTLPAGELTFGAPAIANNMRPSGALDVVKAILKGGKAAFDQWKNAKKAETASSLRLTQADIIECLITKGGPDANDPNALGDLERFSEGADVLQIATTASKAGGVPGKTIGQTSTILAIPMSGAFTHRLQQMAADGQLKAFGFNGWPDPTPRPEVLYGRLASICGKRGHAFTSETGVVGGVDPNQKIGVIGSGAPQYLAGNQPLRYSINFANEVTATAPAQEVVITDTLDPNLVDLSSLQLTEMSFGVNPTGTVAIPIGQLPYDGLIDLRPDQNLQVHLSASLDPVSHVLTWRFTSIDPATGRIPDDPFVGFLPPDTDGSGEGSVSFTIMPKASLSTGTVITNVASIVFDTNAPLSTNAWVNTIDNDAPQSHITTLPALESGQNFVVKWSGTDTGSGISDYTIYVSHNGGPYTLWLANTTDISDTFYAPGGGTYSFFSAARDGAGNVETPRFMADTSTSVGHLVYLPLVRR